MADRIVALLWHQRASTIDLRERLLGTLASGPDRALLATCHRVELYVTGAPDGSGGPELGPEEQAACVIREGTGAVAHLFAVAAGLDSAIVGEPQILGQVRRACREAANPALVSLLSRALRVGRSVRREFGLASARSVGALGVDALLSRVADPARATILVIGAGEMGKLALRALVRRVGGVIVANRDLSRASELASTYGAAAVALDEVPGVLDRSAGVISAADTRGEVLTEGVVRARLERAPLAVVDIAVPRSVAAPARSLLGPDYLSVDDLPGSRSTASAERIAAALECCEREAARFIGAREPDRAAAIREVRAKAERVRAAKLARAMRHLGHLSERDRRVVEAFSANLTNALLHSPTIALREHDAEPAAVRSLFGRTAR